MTVFILFQTDIHRTRASRVFFGVFTGDHYFDSGAEFADFIAPWLAAIEAHPHQDPLLEWGKALFSDADDESRGAQQASQAKNQ